MVFKKTIQCPSIKIIEEKKTQLTKEIDKSCPSTPCPCCRYCVKNIGLWNEGQLFRDWSRWQRWTGDGARIILSLPLTSDRWDAEPLITATDFRFAPLQEQQSITDWRIAAVCFCLSETLSNTQDYHTLLLPCLARSGGPPGPFVTLLICRTHS